jgi:hypothetical protein
VGMVFLYYVDVLTIIFFILKILNSKYYRYASYLAGETFHLHGGTIFTFFAIMVRSSLLFLAIFLMPSIVKKDKEKLFLINMAIIYNYINIIGLRYIIINRVRELFSFVPILISGSAFSVRGKYRKIIVCLIIILNIGLFEITIYNNNRERIGSSVYPYYSIFSKDR